jgi:hypothetical protein
MSRTPTPEEQRETDQNLLGLGASRLEYVRMCRQRFALRMIARRKRDFFGFARKFASR